VNRRLVWVGCGRPADARIEVYGTDAEGSPVSLDATAYACGEHVQPAMAAVDAAGFAPHRAAAPLPLARTCGHIHRFPTASGGSR
jgi:hypothetical protein